MKATINRPGHRVVSFSGTGLAGLVLCWSMLATTGSVAAQAANPPPQTPPPPKVASLDAHKSTGIDHSLLYTVDFPGGTVAEFASFWRTNGFANDSFVMLERTRRARLPGFTVRNARLEEVARCLEFLSEGELVVEAVAQAQGTAEGNLWRIGTPTAETAGSLKMRAFAAPHLFATPDRFMAVMQAAERLSDEMLKHLEVLRHEQGGRRPMNSFSRISPLREQKVFVVIGSEEAVDGLGSFITAAEQAAASEAATFKKGAD